MSFGRIGLHVKGILARKSFTISRDWLALAGTVPLRLARPQIAKPQKHVVNALLTIFFLLVVCLSDGTCVPDAPPETRPCPAPAWHFSHQYAAE